MNQQSQIISAAPKPIVAPPAGNPVSALQVLTTKANPSTPAPVWTRYIDSRLKQFCAR
jgi:hypothetical protein